MIFGDLNSGLDSKEINKKIFIFSFIGPLIAMFFELVFSFGELMIALDDSSVYLYFFIDIGLIVAQAVVLLIAYLFNSKNASMQLGGKRNEWVKIAIRSLSIIASLIFVVVGVAHINTSFYAYSLFFMGSIITVTQIASTVFSFIKIFKKPAEFAGNPFNFQSFDISGEIENAPSSNNVDDAIEVEARDINED